MDLNKILLTSSILLLSSVLFNGVAQKFSLPSLLVFMLVGILAGSDGLLKINFSDFTLAQNIGIISISYILFMGGLSVNFKEIKPIIKEGFLYATFGVLITAVVMAYAIHNFINLNLKECFLLAAIVSSTDAAAVFGILRSKNITLKTNLKALLEFESGSNDPMAVFLTLGVIGLILGKVNFSLLCFDFFKQMVLAVILGVIFSKLFVFIINKIKLDYDNLYAVITTAAVIFTYSVSTYLNANGFLAVYVLGLAMSSAKFIHKKNLTRFHDTLAWLFQIIMFLILGLLIDVKTSLSSFKEAFLAVIILTFVARPIAIFLLSMFFKRKLNEKLLISWVGLRGAAPIVLATFPVAMGVKNGSEIFNIVFYIVIISVLVQGVTIPFLSKILKLNSSSSKSSKYLSVLEYSDVETKNQIIEFEVPKNSIIENKRTDELHLPSNSLLVLIYKKGEYLIPKDEMVINSGDILYVLMDKTKEDFVREIICSKK